MKDRLHYLQWQCACCGHIKLSLIVYKALRAVSTSVAGVSGKQKSEQFGSSADYHVYAAMPSNQDLHSVLKAAFYQNFLQLCFYLGSCDSMLSIKR